jgi:hypothetical protein
MKNADRLVYSLRRIRVTVLVKLFCALVFVWPPTTPHIDSRLEQSWVHCCKFFCDVAFGGTVSYIDHRDFRVSCEEVFHRCSSSCHTDASLVGAVANFVVYCSIRLTTSSNPMGPIGCSACHFRSSARVFWSESRILSDLCLFDPKKMNRSGENNSKVTVSRLLLTGKAFEMQDHGRLLY